MIRRRYPLKRTSRTFLKRMKTTCSQMTSRHTREAEGGCIAGNAHHALNLAVATTASSLRRHCVQQLIERSNHD